MAKFRLKAAPTFDAAVKIPLPGGEVGEIVFTFRHRTKAELDAFMARLQTLTDPEAILEMASGWDLEEPFTIENVVVLLDNHYAAPRQVVDVYVSQLFQAKEKNSASSPLH
ncbi:phage tail assembly chaperone [Pseudacidovorax sp. RU35E]|uniref:phage tail assembly chaperone n=1 Tax=Pseudacidovorax sp. RU35E TaxID=1907403 RepID=UPI0009554497|nr:phage tail assembly chaperone [Pseudacidovorax sp. RU35E]SIQ99818.1 Phage tail assembly chaperone [Pseudacidovorax sp. RU35E]